MRWLARALPTPMRLSRRPASPRLSSTGEPIPGSGVDLPRIIATIVASFLIAFKERSTSRAVVRLAGGGSSAVTRTDKRLLKSLLRNSEGDDAVGKTLASV